MFLLLVFMFCLMLLLMVLFVRCVLFDIVCCVCFAYII